MCKFFYLPLIFLVQQGTVPQHTTTKPPNKLFFVKRIQRLEQEFQNYWNKTTNAGQICKGEEYEISQYHEIMWDFRTSPVQTNFNVTRRLGIERSRDSQLSRKIMGDTNNNIQRIGGSIVVSTMEPVLLPATPDFTTQYIKFVAKTSGRDKLCR